MYIVGNATSKVVLLVCSYDCITEFRGLQFSPMLYVSGIIVIEWKPEPVNIWQSCHKTFVPNRLFYPFYRFLTLASTSSYPFANCFFDMDQRYWYIIWA